MTDVQLFGRIFIRAEIEALTGLLIGASDTGIEIGGVDKAVIRNPLTHEPYVPGSSLRGKMRSQTEKVLGLAQNNRIGQVTIHTCQREEEYHKNGGCPVCHIFGLPGEKDFSSPTRLLVRDTPLLNPSSERGKRVWEKARVDMQYTELKTEVAIDRVTSAAAPRTMERVPAGAIFGPAELVFSIYEAADYGRLRTVIEAMQLVEDDYLGAAGSRGSGKVNFGRIQVSARPAKDYSAEKFFRRSDEQPFESVQELAQAFAELVDWAQKTAPAG